MFLSARKILVNIICLENIEDSKMNSA